VDQSLHWKFPMEIGGTPSKEDEVDLLNNGVD